MSIIKKIKLRNTNKMSVNIFKKFDNFVLNGLK